MQEISNLGQKHKWTVNWTFKRHQYGLCRIKIQLSYISRLEADPPGWDSVADPMWIRHFLLKRIRIWIVLHYTYTVPLQTWNKYVAKVSRNGCKGALLIAVLPRLWKHCIICMAVLSWLIYQGFHLLAILLAILPWLSNPDCPAMAFYSWLSCHGCPLLAAMVWRSSPSCPTIAVPY
jgi:hypothetical protein